MNQLDVIISGPVCDEKMNCLYYTAHLSAYSDVDIDKICDKMVDNMKKKLKERMVLYNGDESNWENGDRK